VGENFKMSTVLNRNLRSSSPLNKQTRFANNTPPRFPQLIPFIVCGKLNLALHLWRIIFLYLAIFAAYTDTGDSIFLVLRKERLT